jgi:hypothetical protein
MKTPDRIAHCVAAYSAAQQWERIATYLWHRAMGTGDWAPWRFAVDAMRVCENTFRMRVGA